MQCVGAKLKNQKSKLLKEISYRLESAMFYALHIKRKLCKVKGNRILVKRVTYFVKERSGTFVGSEFVNNGILFLESIPLHV